MEKEAKIIRDKSYLHEDVMSLAKNFVCVCGGKHTVSIMYWRLLRSLSQLYIRRRFYVIPGRKTTLYQYIIVQFKYVVVLS